MFDSAGGNQDSDVEVQMAPLIDCVFLLLIFFLVATTLKEHERRVELELPQARHAIKAPKLDKPLIIAINEIGDYFVNGEPASLEALHSRIKKEAEHDPNQRVRVDFDRNTRGQHIVHVLDLCQFEGLTNVGIHIEDPVEARRRERKFGTSSR